MDWLTYNPLQMWSYDRLAQRDAHAVATAISELFPEVRRVVDVGAGTGAYAAALRSAGFHTAACERSLPGRLIAHSRGLEVAPFDLRRTPPADLPNGFDLAYSFEVAEHLAEPLGIALVDFLVRLAPVILFTAASPGQGGLGHVNEQPPSYWISRFSQQGADHRPDLSNHLRSALRSNGVTAEWLAQNMLVFERAPCREATLTSQTSALSP